MSYAAEGYQSDPEHSAPLQHKRPFGAGIKRKRIDFVPQSAETSEAPRITSQPAGDAYLSIVLRKEKGAAESQALDETLVVHVDDRAASAPPDVETLVPQQSILDEADVGDSLCPICRLPVTSTSSDKHASTLAHQVCLPHTHPPSHLDRNRKGLAVLSSYGWDPDARVGLGAGGDGRLFPVRAKEKEGKTGIGAEELDSKGPSRQREKIKKEQQTRKEKIKSEKEKAVRDEKMKSLLFGRDEVNAQLGLRL